MGVRLSDNLWLDNLTAYPCFNFVFKNAIRYYVDMTFAFILKWKLHGLWPKISLVCDLYMSKSLITMAGAVIIA